MNKALTTLNDGQKKPPHHVGEDRDGVYGKEKTGDYSVVLNFWAEVCCKPEICCSICCMRC